MSATEAVKAARAAGVELHLDGDHLVLEASALPPAEVVEQLARHKPAVIALLRPGRDGWSAEDWLAFFNERAGIAEFDGGRTHHEAEAHAYESCVLEWLNRHAEATSFGQCADCRQPVRPDHIVVAFSMGNHAWLHPHCCWLAWHELRRSRAIAALMAMGIVPATHSTATLPPNGDPSVSVLAI